MAKSKETEDQKKYNSSEETTRPYNNSCVDPITSDIVSHSSISTLQHDSQKHWQKLTSKITLCFQKKY